MHRITIVALLCAISPASGQSLAQRVASIEGTVQVIYASRAGVCGDGRTTIGNLLGRSTYYTSGATTDDRGNWPRRECVAGPARVAATVIGGEVTRLRAFVGPIPPSDFRTINASAAEVRDWLAGVIAGGSSGVASDAMLPLILADGGNPWPALLRVARDETRPLGVRRAALGWLSTGVAEHLGLTDDGSDSDDDEMRKQAVFVLSQRPKNESVPELIELARSAKRPAARRMAIFWLGQSGDMRAADVYADLLKLR